MIGSALARVAFIFLFAPGIPACAGEMPAPVAFGAAWYPEQWPESRWDADLTLMEQAHFNTVRIGEFAWSTIAPNEGSLDFGWLDRAIAAAARHHIRVVLGTPTAAPPVWLTQHYPDTRRVDENGTVAGHGGRRQFSFASMRYRHFAHDIAAALAHRYGHNATVIGWQIDNEIGLPSYDDEARAQWAAFLQARYGDIGTLNRRWNTAYWSQTYQRFNQIPLHGSGQENPSLLLDARHFWTETWTRYVTNQADAIRAEIGPHQFVTTNTMHWNDDFDHFRLHAGLDLAAWDNYITTPEPDWVENGANHDLVRGYKGRNFWVMETQAGRIDWTDINRALRPGQVREMGWQAVMHGADGLLYWQYRAGLGGQETNYGTLVGADGTPVPVFAEIAKLGAEFASVAPLLRGTAPQSSVAMIWSYDSRWALDLQRMHRDFDPTRQFVAIYRPLRNAAQAIDVVAPDAPIARYRLVVAPSLNVLSQATADHLLAYVRAGGHLVIGPRTGQKDDANALWPLREPGPLAAALGAHAEQSYALDGKVALTGVLGGNTAAIWADALVADTPDTRVLAGYSQPGGWLDGRGALVMRKLGLGSITSLGTWPDGAGMAALVRLLMEQSGIAQSAVVVDDAVEIGVRVAADHRVLIAINHGDVPHGLPLPVGAHIVIGGMMQGQIPPHEVIVARLAPL